MKPKNNSKKVLIGKREVEKAGRAELLSSIYLATDADEAYKNAIFSLAEEHNIPIFQENTAEEVAQKYGIEVKCGVVGIPKDIKS